MCSKYFFAFFLLLLSTSCDNYKKKKNFTENTSDTPVLYNTIQNKDTVIKFFRTDGKTYHDNFTVKSIYTTLSNTIDPNLKDYIEVRDFKIFFDKKKVDDICNKFINQIATDTINSQSIDYYLKIKRLNTSFSHESESTKNTYSDLIYFILNRTKFSIIKLDSNTNPDKLVIESYFSDLSKGKNYYLVFNNGDSLNFLKESGIIK